MTTSKAEPSNPKAEGSYLRGRHDFLIKDPGGYLSQVPLNSIFSSVTVLKCFFSLETTLGMFDM